jgi:hypothetical protein
MSEDFVADRIFKIDIVVYYYCLWMMFQGLQIFLGYEISLLYSFVIRYVISIGIRRNSQEFVSSNRETTKDLNSKLFY